MKTSCLKYEKNTKNLNPKISKLKNNRLIMQLKCSECGIKNQDLLKNKKQNDY